MADAERSHLKRRARRRSGSGLLLLCLAACGLPAFGEQETEPAREGKPDRFSLGTRALYLSHGDLAGARTDLVALELSAFVRGERWSFESTLAGLSVRGPESVAGVGPSFGLGGGGASGSGAGSGDGSGAGSGSGTGGTGNGGTGQTRAAALPAVDPAVAATTPTAGSRQGLGDLRLSLRRSIGPSRSWGRLALRGGLKIPTASEQEGFGTGETDGWVGLDWTRQGWSVDVTGWSEWVRLGDSATLELRDGPAAGIQVSRPGARRSWYGGVDAARSPYAGESTRARVHAGCRGPAGRRGNWEVDVQAGLTEDAPDAGVALAWFF